VGSLEKLAGPDMSLGEKKTVWKIKSFRACTRVRSEKRDGLKRIVE
jgi:hypothetical protein